MNKILNLIGAVSSTVPDSIKQFGAAFTGVTLSEASTPESIGDAKKHLISVGVAIISQIAYTLSKKLIDGINKWHKTRKSKKHA